jgi:superfamily II DNA or RNA helicase
MAEYDKLFAAIRQKATAGAWSSGVSLARDNKVVKEDEDDDTVTFRVVAGARGQAYAVDLMPDDLDWQCDCGSREACCEHVAAAIIALRSADKEGKEVPTHRPEIAKLAYRLTSEDGLLCIERMRTGASREVPWSQPLGGGRVNYGDPMISTSTGDMEVDIALGTWRRGRVPRNDLPRLLKALAKCDGQVTFDGRGVTVSLRPVYPILSVEDANRGFFAQLKPDPIASHRFRNGAALVGDTLRPIDDDAGISEGDRRHLERGRAYGPDEVTELMHLITRLEKTLTVVRHSKRLPRGQMEPPRLIIETSTVDDQLVVFPTLVYGDPPVARVDRGNLTILDERAEFPIRDEKDEQRLAQRLFQSLGLEVGRKVSFEAQEAIAFSARLEAFRKGPGKSLAQISGNAQDDFSIAAGPLTGKVSFSSDDFDLIFETADGERANAARVMKAWARGATVAPLEGGGFAPIPTRWLAEYGPTLLGLVRAKEASEKDENLPLAAVSDVLTLADKLGTRPPPKFERLRALVSDFTKLPPPDLPADLTAELRPYQRDGVAWLGFHREAGLGALLADDMGLGKTLQALTALRGRSLVVAPTSVLHNWARESQKFRPNLKVTTYHGSGRKLDKHADVVLTTWGTMRMDIDTLAQERWDTVILDEAQTIKNPDSQVARAAHRLSGKFRLALTGTPVENRLEDLWSQMAFVEPGFLGDRKFFDERYAQPIGNGDALRAQELRQRLRPFMLRRKKAEVATDLPPRTEIVERCELSQDERLVYDALRAAAQKEVLETLSSGGSVLQALELLLRLRQAACHRGLIPGQDVTGSSAKIDLLSELLEELTSEGHKVLVFSQWTSLLDRIEPMLEKNKTAFLRLDGSTTDRQAVVDGFQNPAGPPVMLLSLKAGGTGLTLTAADHVVIMDPWWNPAVEDQAADRAHRIGQDKPVFVHRLVAADTVEERILALQENKRKLADAALAEGAGGVGLTREDLLNLLG